MEELSYQEQLNLENSREHLRVILNNLRVANGELSDVLKRTADAEKNLEVINTERDLLATIVSTKRREIDDKETELNNRESILNDEKSKFEDKRAGIIQELELLTNKLNGLVVQINVSKSEHNRLVELRNITISQLNDKIENLKTISDEQQNTTNEKRGEIKKLEDEVDRLNTQIQEAKKDLESFMLTSFSQKEEIKKLLDEERMKISKPLSILRDAEELLKKKEKNLAIIKARLVKQFILQNKNLTLPIDLQDNENK